MDIEIIYETGDGKESGVLYINDATSSQIFAYGAADYVTFSLLNGEEQTQHKVTQTVIDHKNQIFKVYV